jgi:hypothetical protein
MLIRCVESSLLVGCACNILIGCVLIFILSLLGPSSFSSLHPLRSQDAHNGGFQGLFCLSSTKNGGGGNLTFLKHFYDDFLKTFSDKINIVCLFFFFSLYSVWVLPGSWCEWLATETWTFGVLCSLEPYTNLLEWKVEVESKWTFRLTLSTSTVPFLFGGECHGCSELWIGKRISQDKQMKR